MTVRLFVAGLGAALLSACASVPKEAGFSAVEQIAQERLGHTLHWRRGDPEDAQVDEHVRALLGRELSLEAAVEVALLENRGLQATYEGLGIAQADLVQAGLLRNPRFGVSVLFPSQSGANLGTDFSLAQDFLDLLMLPLRKRIAGLQFEQARLRVSDAVLKLAGEVRRAWYTLQGAGQLREMWSEIVDGNSAVAEFAAAQRQAGNIRELELALEQDAFEGARLNLARSEADLLESHEHLARLLGVWGAQAGFKSPGRLSELPAEEMPLEHLESVAIAQRLDLGAARIELDVLTQAAAAAGISRFLPGVQIGVSTQVESPDNVRATGPTLSLELPLFDQGQPRLARLEAQLRQAVDRYQQVAVDVRSEVRAARSRVLSWRGLATHYQRVVIPQREKILQLTQQQYNAMQQGLFQLVQARSREIDSYREYIEALRDYWMARSDLELAIGGGRTKGYP